MLVVYISFHLSLSFTGATLFLQFFHCVFRLSGASPRSSSLTSLCRRCPRLRFLYPFPPSASSLLSSGPSPLSSSFPWAFSSGQNGRFDCTRPKPDNKSVCLNGGLVDLVHMQFWTSHRRPTSHLTRSKFKICWYKTSITWTTLYQGYSVVITKKHCNQHEEQRFSHLGHNKSSYIVTPQHKAFGSCPQQQ